MHLKILTDLLIKRLCLNVSLKIPAMIQCQTMSEPVPEKLLLYKNLQKCTHILKHLAQKYRSSPGVLVGEVT
jgi:hypothetical protein